MATKKAAGAVPTKSPHATWVAEIEASERELKKFYERGLTVTKRYLDERDVITSSQKWFNIYYANTVILESALYAQAPKPAVSRRFKDFDDDVGRVASDILQRCITQDLDDPRDTFNAVMRHAVQDRLVPGLAQAWLRLETDIEETPPQPDTEVEDDEGDEPMLKIKDQRVCIDYVYWKDFLWSPCRVWEERRWIGRKVYMSREELIERFGAAKGAAVPLDYKPVRLGEGTGTGVTPIDDTIQKAVIYEIWVRKSKRVIWLSRGCSELLDEKDDPLKLVGFEPCPTPMLANISTSNTTPRPDYYMIQDQYSELDQVNHRISMLIKACKVVGVYDKGATGVARMLKEGFDNDMIPVDNWAMFAEKGGIKGQVDWLPLEQVVKALQQLLLNRDAIKNQIYELTGIADIVRGATKASETLGAQEIKAKFASVRIKKLQDEVARFAADILRIKAEIMVKHFEPEILKKVSNIEQTQDAEFADAAISLLKDAQSFEWRIEVSADSIAQADYDLEKQDRVEFLTAVSGYLEKAGAMFQTVPQSAPLLVGMLKWAVAGFRKASEIEGMIDKALDDLVKNPPQQGPSPEQQKMDLEKQKIDSKAQQDQQKAQLDAQMAQQQMQMDMQRQQMEMQMEQQKMAMEMQMMQQKMQMEQKEMEMKLMFEELMARVKLGVAQATSQQQMASSQQEHELNMQAQQAEHEQSLTTQKEVSEATVQAKKAEAAAVHKKPAGGKNGS